MSLAAAITSLMTGTAYKRSAELAGIVGAALIIVMGTLLGIVTFGVIAGHPDAYVSPDVGAGAVGIV